MSHVLDQQKLSKTMKQADFQRDDVSEENPFAVTKKSAQLSYNADFDIKSIRTAKSKYMNVHTKKITEKLTGDEQQDIMGRYLTMKNKLGMNYLKPEIEGLKQEKEEAQLNLADQKRKIIYAKEDLTIVKM